MSKVIFLRHQNEGLIWQFPFAQQPTEAQTKAIREVLEAKHGKYSKRCATCDNREVDHPHSDCDGFDAAPLKFWTMEVEVLGPEAIPTIELPRSNVSASGKAEVGDVTITAVAQVEAPSSDR